MGILTCNAVWLRDELSWMAVTSLVWFDIGVLLSKKQNNTISLRDRRSTNNYYNGSIKCSSLIEQCISTFLISFVTASCINSSYQSGTGESLYRPRSGTLKCLQLCMRKGAGLVTMLPWSAIHLIISLKHYSLNLNI